MEFFFLLIAEFVASSKPHDQTAPISIKTHTHINYNMAYIERARNRYIVRNCYQLMTPIIPVF